MYADISLMLIVFRLLKLKNINPFIPHPLYALSVYRQTIMYLIVLRNHEIYLHYNFTSWHWDNAGSSNLSGCFVFVFLDKSLCIVYGKNDDIPFKNKNIEDCMYDIFYSICTRVRFALLYQFPMWIYKIYIYIYILGITFLPLSQSCDYPCPRKITREDNIY